MVLVGQEHTTFYTTRDSHCSGAALHIAIEQLKACEDFSINCYA